MSIFGKIMSSLFGHARGDAASTPTSAGGPGAAAPPTVPSPSTAPSAGTAASGAAHADKQTPVDVAAVLGDLASRKSEKLDWRHSIVDLMKVLDLDSSLAARRELAAELHYPGDTGDSAAMNMWLHKHVMQKLAENGGKVPEELKA